MNLLKKFVSDYLEHEGALSERTLMSEPIFGLHNIVKSILNALWGKFAQNKDRDETVYVKVYEELIEFLDSCEYESVYFDFVDHNVLRLSCRKRSNQIPYSSDTNVAIARLRLYQTSIALPSQCVLYYNTDSVIYHSPDGNELIKCGSFLGELKNELNMDEHIVEFCSTGPKCYSSLTSKNVEVVHVKGFKIINHDVDGLINYASMNDVVCNRSKTVSVKRN